MKTGDLFASLQTAIKQPVLRPSPAAFFECFMSEPCPWLTALLCQAAATDTTISLTTEFPVVRNHWSTASVVPCRRQFPPQQLFTLISHVIRIERPPSCTTVECSRSIRRVLFFPVENSSRKQQKNSLKCHFPPENEGLTFRGNCHCCCN